MNSFKIEDDEYTPENGFTMPHITAEGDEDNAFYPASYGDVKLLKDRVQDISANLINLTGTTRQGFTYCSQMGRDIKFAKNLARINFAGLALLWAVVLSMLFFHIGL